MSIKIKILVIKFLEFCADMFKAAINALNKPLGDKSKDRFKDLMIRVRTKPTPSKRPISLKGSRNIDQRKKAIEVLDEANKLLNSGEKAKKKGFTSTFKKN